MIQTSYFLWPDGNRIKCYAWTHGHDDSQSYHVTKKVLASIYPDMPLDAAINHYAVTRFTLFHEVDFEGRFISHHYIVRRNSI